MIKLLKKPLVYKLVSSKVPVLEILEDNFTSTSYAFLRKTLKLCNLVIRIEIIY